MLEFILQWPQTTDAANAANMGFYYVRAPPSLEVFELAYPRQKAKVTMARRIVFERRSAKRSEVRARLPPESDPLLSLNGFGRMQQILRFDILVYCCGPRLPCGACSCVSEPESDKMGCRTCWRTKLGHLLVISRERKCILGMNPGSP